MNYGLRKANNDAQSKHLPTFDYCRDEEKSVILQDKNKVR